MLDYQDIIMIVQLIFRSLTGVGVIVGAMVALIIFISISKGMIKNGSTNAVGWVIIAAVLLIASLFQIWLWS